MSVVDIRPEEIQPAREAIGLSREGLAYKAGIAIRTIERIEAGTAEPRRSTLAVIQLALDQHEAEMKTAA